MATAKPLEERLEPPMLRVELQPAAQPPTLPATVGAFRIAGGFRAWDLFEGPHTVMQCFYMGSTRTNNGIGKYKSSKGKEYDLQF